MEDTFGVGLTRLYSTLEALMDIKLWLPATRNTLFLVLKATHGRPLQEDWSVVGDTLFLLDSDKSFKNT